MSFYIVSVLIVILLIIILFSANLHSVSLSCLILTSVMTRSVTLQRVILLKVMPPLFDLAQQKLQTELETRLQKEMPSLADTNQGSFYLLWLLTSLQSS